MAGTNDEGREDSAQDRQDASTARLVPVLAFVEALAALYADLWLNGKLDQIREESIDEEDDE